MQEFSYAVQVSHDRGVTWQMGELTHAGPEWCRHGSETLDAAELAADVLDRAYRSYFDGDGIEPVPLLQVLVWRGVGLIPQGVPLAMASIGQDRQWEATGDLIAEIAADIRTFEEEKKRHEEQAAACQTAIRNAKARLARVVISADRMNMPQVDIAHRAGRSREWVRKITS